VVVTDSLKKLAHLRERPDPGQIFFPEQLGSVFVELFAEICDFFFGQELGQILIGALSDLRP
jgi:hypothetical protein